MSNFFESASLINPSSYFEVNSIGLLVIGSSLANMKEKAGLNMEPIEIDLTILQNTENFLKSFWISNY